MRSLKYISVSFFVASLLLQSCAKEINIDLKSTYTRLVVEGTITTDTMSQWVRLAKTADYFSNKDLDPVDNAKVQIFDGADTTNLTESTIKPGYYFTTSGFHGITGKTYNLIINNVDIDRNGKMETYTASSYLRPVPDIDSISLVATKMYGDDGYEVMFWGQDPGNTHDYYLFRIRRNGIMLTDSINEAITSDDEILNGKYLSNISVYYLYKSKTDENIQKGDILTLEFSDITKEYYRFIQDIQQEYNGSSPLAGQPANISTNISNSDIATGFFTAYGIKRMSMVVKLENLGVL